jgi:phosphonate transport system substrate-binding protein
MIKILHFFLLLLFLSTVALANGPEKVILGFVPGENPEKLKKDGIELAKYLEKKLHIPMEIFIPQNYDGLIEAMAQKKVDFGFFTALTFVEAEKKSSAKVLLKKVWDSPFYYGAMITLENSGLDSIQKLKAKRIGFVDEKSASGYLYPMVMLKKKGIDPKKYFSKITFYGNHQAAVEALYNKQADAVAVYSDNQEGTSGAWTKLKDKKEIQFIWMSDPIPNDPFCVRQDFYEKYPRYTHDLMFTLIDMQDDPEEKKLLKALINVESLALATSRQYDPVRELAKYLK